jgi:O-antigen ligase
MFWYLLISPVARTFLGTILIQPQTLLLAVLLVYLTASAASTSMDISGRQLKDHLYFLYWIMVLPLLPIFFLSRDASISSVVLVLSRSLVVFSVFSAILAFLIFFDVVNINIGSLQISQSIYLAFRIHGTLGESTALAALIGLGMISLLYIKYQTGHTHKIIFGFLLFSLVATGSRNGLLSIALALLVSVCIEGLDFKKLLRFMGVLCVVLPILGLVLYVSGAFELIYIIFFDRPDLDLYNEFSRPYIWLTTLEMISNSTVSELLFGHGAYQLRSEFRAGFNSPLEIAYDYGILASLIYVAIFFLSFFVGLTKYRSTKMYIYKYACLSLVYGFTFSMFMSYFPTTMFNFSIWAYMIGFWITAIPSRMLSDGNITDDANMVKITGKCVVNN